MGKLFVLILMAMPFVNIQAQESENGLTQMQKVVKVHDAIMEKDMGKTVKLINQLETKIKSDGPAEEYEKAIEDLKAANKAMMVWMQGFGTRFEADEMYKNKPLNDQKKEWLNEEEKKLYEMKDLLESSIEAAETLLNSGQ